MDLLDWLLHGTISIAGGHLNVREVIGNGFGLASAVLGMRRVMWAWPVGLVGNVVLFTVFATGELGGISSEPLWGQALRQVFFAAVSIYGWYAWSRSRDAGGASDGKAIAPRWATGRERLLLVGLAVVGYVVAYPVLTWMGSWGPQTEAWIVAGSMLATWGMARGWVEFWLVWVAVDVVGVWTLVDAGYYATAGMYLFYGVFVIVGFFTWWHAERGTHQVTDAERVAA
jgi:nicotinamide mononucleotide transporter